MLSVTKFAMNEVSIVRVANFAPGLTARARREPSGRYMKSRRKNHINLLIHGVDNLKKYWDKVWEEKNPQIYTKYIDIDRDYTFIRYFKKYELKKYVM